MPAPRDAAGPRPAGRQPARAGRILLLIALAVATLAAIEIGVEAMRARRAPAGDATWIWAELAPEALSGQRAVTFFAVRDVALDRAPETARLLVTADEAYIVWLNGRPVGSARSPAQPRVAAFEVGELLDRGPNRIVVEARSDRGVGGLLVSLEVDGRRVEAAASGAEWRITRRWEEVLLRPGAEIPGAEPPYLWSRAPTGRWGTPALAPEAPSFDRLLASSRTTPPARALVLGAREPWRAVSGPVDWRTPVLGHRASFDWGGEVDGFLNVVFETDEPAHGLVWFGAERQQARRRAADRIIVHPGGRDSWSTTEPLAFRYVTVESTAPLRGARLIPTRRVAAADTPSSGRKTPRGVFGIPDPPPMPVPAEDTVRREIDRVAVSGGDEGAESPSG